jgi:hypothetical protein
MAERTIRLAVCFGLLCALLGIGFRSPRADKSPTDTPPAATPRQARLETFLRRYIGPRDSDDNRSTRYQFASVSLTGRGARDVIVYLMGQELCGSGGCTMLILTPLGSSYESVARLLAIHPPVSVLTSTSHGWHDIGVWVGGGGIASWYEARLRFDGRTYRFQPRVTLRPSRRPFQRLLPGRVVISANVFGESKFLYPGEVRGGALPKRPLTCCQ